MKKLLQKTRGIFARAFGATGRCVRSTFRLFARPAALFRGRHAEIVRAAGVGLVLLGVAGAGYGFESSGGLFLPADKNAALATVRIGVGTGWVSYGVAGMAVGAVLAAAATFVARKVWKDRGAVRVLVAMGVVGGVLSGATWGSAIARERVVEMKAQRLTAPPAPGAQAADKRFTVVGGGVRLTGTVGRDVNYVLLSFMLLSGAVIGVLAARGLALPPMAGRMTDDPGALPFGQPNQNQPGNGNNNRRR
jgi:hypothetical protein